MEDKILDIIIPAFNAHNTIVRTLSSIIMQTIKDSCRITIVNDCGENYKEIIEYFNKHLDIREITLKKNGGPGVARQFGMDHTELPFLTFIDADDTFYGAIALEVLLGTMFKYEHCNMAVSNFIEQTYNPTLMLFPHSKSMVWMFGKIYRREFLKKNNIRFNETRSNEDTGFNTLCQLSCPDAFEEEIVFIEDNFYLWHFNPNSITRTNGCEYAYNDNLLGFSDNMIYAIKEAEKANPFNSEKINEKKIEVMVQLYYLYLRISQLSTKFKKKNVFACVKFYNEVFKEFESTIDSDTLSNKFLQHNDKLTYMTEGILPDMTFLQFYQAIRSAPYDPSMSIN